MMTRRSSRQVSKIWVKRYVIKGDVTRNGVKTMLLCPPPRALYLNLHVHAAHIHASAKINKNGTGTTLGVRFHVCEFPNIYERKMGKTANFTNITQLAAPRDCSVKFVNYINDLTN